MAKFAVIDKDNTVINIIEAIDSLVAQELTGLKCLEFTDELVHIGEKFNSSNNTFSIPSPYPSWVLLDNKWIPPISKPADEADGRNYIWDESKVSWIEEPLPKSWSWDSNLKQYIPPTLPPGYYQEYIWDETRQIWIPVKDAEEEELKQLGSVRERKSVVLEQDVLLSLQSKLKIAEPIDAQSINVDLSIKDIDGTQGL